MDKRELDWSSQQWLREGKLVVYLTGQEDPAWADDFYEARLYVLRRRRARGRPPVEIVMDGSKITLSEIPNEEEQQLKDELQEIVEVTNEAVPDSSA
jgi:hypothetical protein